MLSLFSNAAYWKNTLAKMGAWSTRDRVESTSSPFRALCNLDWYSVSPIFTLESMKLRFPPRLVSENNLPRQFSFLFHSNSTPRMDASWLFRGWILSGDASEYATNSMGSNNCL